MNPIKGVRSFYAILLAGAAAIVACIFGVLCGMSSLYDLIPLAVLGLAGLAWLSIERPAVVFIGLWLFEVIQLPLANLAGDRSATGTLINEADDGLIFLLLLFTVARLLSSHASGHIRIPKLYSVGIGIFVFCGLVSAVVQDVSPFVAVLGMWEGSKLFTVLLLAIYTPWTEVGIKRALACMSAVGVLVALLGFVNRLEPAQFDRALHISTTTATFRANAITSIFPTAGEFAFFMALSFAIAFMFWFREQRPWWLMVALVSFVAGLLSLRIKGMVELLAVPIIGICIHPIRRTGLRFAMLAIVIGAAIGIGTVYRSVIDIQIRDYTQVSTVTQPRTLLYRTGDQIANSDLPLGAGFGRFASYPAERYYSPLYDQYGISSVYGMSREDGSYLTDTSWPAVIGETGWLGFLGYVGAIVGVLSLLSKYVRRGLDHERRHLAAIALVALIVFLIDSLANPTLFDGLPVVSLGLLFSFAIGPRRSILVPDVRAPERKDTSSSRGLNAGGGEDLPLSAPGKPVMGNSR